MAGDQPSSASPRPQPHRRTSSTVSLGKAAAGAGTGGQRTKASKTHTVGKHNRNRSFGKDLQKLARLNGIDDASVRPSAMGRTSSNPGQTPSSVTTVKRNKSDVALPRTGSKVHIKKNQSAVNLRRNESHTKLKRSSRPTTPRETQHDDDSQQKYTQPAFHLDADEDEEEEDDWTEESASVSPVITRSGSMKGQRPNVNVNGDRSGVPSPLKQGARAESPTTPLAEPTSSTRPVQSGFESNSSRLPDPRDVTKRLLHRGSSQQLAPHLSTISAGGSSGTQSPVHVESNGRVNSSPTLSRTPSMPSQPSTLPSEGVSRFLDPLAASSSGRNTYSSQMQGALESIQAHDARSRSPSPNTANDRALPRAKSVSHFSERELEEAKAKGANVKIKGAHLDSDPRSWTIDPSNYKVHGGNTVAKMAIWKSQANVEPSAGPPAPLIGKGVEAQKYMGAEERRLRMAEEAEAELNYLRLFRNPAIESIERLQALRKRKQKDRKRASLEDSDGRHANGVSTPRNKSRRSERRPDSSHETPNGTPSSSLGTTVAGSAGTSGRRSVRFSVGADGNDESDLHEDVTEEARLASMLRGLWTGGEADAASVD